MSLRDDALAYHSHEKAGKLEIIATKPLSTQYDLSLAYSPGVAEPCREIAADADRSFLYTARANLVAVISDGSAVLGLGNIGPEASKPVMEGKAVLFKKFAGVDSVDLELRRESIDAFIETIASLEPSFGGINLEDIKAPECFEIEARLKQRMAIPVMHDDQHGTAIISGAALVNGLEIAGKNLADVNVVVLGAGAAAIACARFYLTLGVQRDHIVMIDKDGVLRNDGSRDLGYMAEFATDRPVSDLAEALRGADVLLGLSAGNIVSQEMVRSMADNPIIFALANPDPEIGYDEARAARKDLIMATGRSDTPNQVNNVLGFPYIFRGALDVGAREINDQMKVAAAEAIAALAREPVPEAVSRVYAVSELEFGREYLIPKPLDPRLITTIAPAVARAAMETGVARGTITDWPQYEARLLERVGLGQKLITGVISQARRAPKRVVFPEAEDYEVIKAAQIAASQGIADPILLGRRGTIDRLIQQHGLRLLEQHTIIDPSTDKERLRRYAELYFATRQRRGVTLRDARQTMQDLNYFGAAMVETGEADAMVSGRTLAFPRVIKPALQIIGMDDTTRRVAGMYLVNTRHGAYFFADTTVNIDPDVAALLDIVGLTAQTVRRFNLEPVIAVIGHSNFGSVKSTEAAKAAEVVRRSWQRYPGLIIDGELQANVALDSELLAKTYPFSKLVGHRVNTLVFADLSPGNVAYKLLGHLGDAELIGPILMGMKKPVHVLQMGSNAREIVNIVALAVAEAQGSAAVTPAM